MEMENLLIMTKNEYKVLRKYQKMKPSEFIEYAFGIKLFAYQKILIDVFADKKKFYFPIYRRVGLK